LIQGSCGCGNITFQFDATNTSLINCHCDMCRIHNGSAFSSYVIARRDGFILNDEAKRLTRYHKDNVAKYFCADCGTPIYNSHDNYDSIFLVYLGALQETREMRPGINVWCENQLPWVTEISAIKSVAQGAG